MQRLNLNETKKRRRKTRDVKERCCARRFKIVWASLPAIDYPVSPCPYLPLPPPPSPLPLHLKTRASRSHPAPNWPCQHFYIGLRLRSANALVPVNQPSTRATKPYGKEGKPQHKKKSIIAMHQPVPQIRAGTTVHRNSTIVEDDSQQNSIYQRERSTNRVINASWRETLHLLLQGHTKRRPHGKLSPRTYGSAQNRGHRWHCRKHRHGHQRTTKNTAVIPRLLVLLHGSKHKRNTVAVSQVSTRRGSFRSDACTTPHGRHAIKCHHHQWYRLAIELTAAPQHLHGTLAHHRTPVRFSAWFDPEPPPPPCIVCFAAYVVASRACACHTREILPTGPGLVRSNNAPGEERLLSQEKNATKGGCPLAMPRPSPWRR